MVHGVAVVSYNLDQNQGLRKRTFSPLICDCIFIKGLIEL